MDTQLKHHLAAGREFYRAGEYDKARPHLEAVRQVHDDFADVHNMLGFIHYDQGRRSEARHEFERALEINPHYTEAALNLAVVYNDLGMYEESRTLYEEAHNSRGSGGLEELEPLARGKIANMHCELGDAYTSVDLPNHAIKEYRKALRICPTFVDIRTKLANTLRDLGRFDEALDEFQAICDIAPHYLPARTHYGVTLWRKGRIAEARAQWGAVLEESPDNRSCQIYLRMTEQESDNARPTDDAGTEPSRDADDEAETAGPPDPA